MRPLLTTLAVLLLIGFSLIYIKDFGWDSYEELLLKGGIQTCITIVGMGVLADLIANRD